MRCVKPIIIDDARMISSTTPDIKPCAAAWVSGTTYAKGAVVSHSATFREYARLVAGAGTTAPDADTANWADAGAYERLWVSGTTYAVSDYTVSPADHGWYMRITDGAGTADPSTDALNWLYQGKCNKWAMFDTLRNSATTHTEPLTVVINPATRVSSVILMGCVATEATVTLTVGANVMYTHTQNMLERRPRGWSSYFFDGFDHKPSLVLFDIPQYSGGVITITLTNATADVECGAVVIGNPIYMGQAQYNAVSSALNFSTIERDTFGNTTLIPRRSVPRTDQTLFCDKSLVDTLRKLRIDINAVPCVFSALDDRNTDGYFESFLILGIYKEFSINAAYPNHAIATLQLEEI